MAVSSVLIDSREPEWVRRLTFGGVPTATTALETGDFLCACTDGEIVAIERKEATDLLNSLRDDRLYTQLAKLRQSYTWAYLLICGPLSQDAEGHVVTKQRVTGWQWSALQGALLDIQEIGVNVMQIGDGPQDLERAILQIGNRSRSVKRIAPPRNTHLLSEGEACIAALPGIGMEKLTSVLEDCDRPFWALVALTQRNGVDHIRGIGPGIRANIRKALGFTDKYEDLELVALPAGTEVKVL